MDIINFLTIPADKDLEYIFFRVNRTHIVDFARMLKFEYRILISIFITRFR